MRSLCTGAGYEERSWRPLLRYSLPGCDRRGRPVLIEAVGSWDMEAGIKG